MRFHIAIDDKENQCNDEFVYTAHTLKGALAACAHSDLYTDACKTSLQSFKLFIYDYSFTGKVDGWDVYEHNSCNITLKIRPLNYTKAQTVRFCKDNRHFTSEHIAYLAQQQHYGPVTAHDVDVYLNRNNSRVGNHKSPFGI